MIKIAILDSGIEYQHKNFRNVSIKHTYKTDNSFSSPLNIDHGTSVADVLKKSIEKNGHLQHVELYDIQVYDEFENITNENIIKGIEYCINNNIDIINISLGVPSDSPNKSLYDICYKAYKKDIIIVASGYYMDISCFPASFPFVFGVTGGTITSLKKYGIQVGDDIELIGRGSLQRVATLNNNTRFVAGTSFAAAHLSGIICSLKQQNKSLSFQDIKKHLFLYGQKNIPLIVQSNKRKDGSDNNINFSVNSNYWKKIEKYFNREEKFGWMNKISIYPVSIKEFSGLELFLDMCPFNVIDFIDLPSSITKNNEITINNNKIKKKWKKEHLSNDIDTLVLGYANDLALQMNSKFYNELLHFYAKNKVSIFALNKTELSEYKTIYSKYNDEEPRQYFPAILKQDIPYFNYLKKSGKISTPVLGIAGLTAQSGKFTTQLKIKKLLNHQKYKVGWLSTEPQGELFGADISFPYGLRSNVDFGLEEWPQLLSSIIKGIEYTNNPDIIITGHQSGLIPFSKNLSLNSNYGNFCSLYFFGGISPDAVVLNASINDDIKLIKRNIEVLKNLYGIKVIFIVLSLKYREVITGSINHYTIVKKMTIDKTTWQNRAEEIKREFNIPVVNIFDSNDDNIILDRIINFFSE